jgi:glutaredoxin
MESTDVQATVYSKPMCPQCDVVKRQLREENIVYTEIVVGVDIDRDKFMTLFPHVRSMPHVVFH